MRSWRVSHPACGYHGETDFEYLPPSSFICPGCGEQLDVITTDEEMRPTRYIYLVSTKERLGKKKQANAT